MGPTARSAGSEGRGQGGCGHLDVGVVSEVVPRGDRGDGHKAGEELGVGDKEGEGEGAAGGGADQHHLLHAQPGEEGGEEAHRVREGPLGPALLGT